MRSDDHAGQQKADDRQDLEAMTDVGDDRAGDQHGHRLREKSVHRAIVWRHAMQGNCNLRSRTVRAMNVTRIYLVRHGATQLTAEDRFSGSAGVDLSDEGCWQAKQLGERLREEGITAAYCSPLSRSADTARLIAGECGLKPIHRDGLREI